MKKDELRAGKPRELRFFDSFRKPQAAATAGLAEIFRVCVTVGELQTNFVSSLKESTFYCKPLLLNTKISTLLNKTIKVLF